MPTSQQNPLIDRLAAIPYTGAISSAGSDAVVAQAYPRGLRADLRLFVPG